MYASRDENRRKRNSQTLGAELKIHNITYEQPNVSYRYYLCLPSYYRTNTHLSDDIFVIARRIKVTHERILNFPIVQLKNNTNVHTFAINKFKESIILRICNSSLMCYRSTYFTRRCMWTYR